MRFHTFLVTGREVLELGGEHGQSNTWPLEHWKLNGGRWRLFTPAVDDYVSGMLQGRHYGDQVGGLVIALEVADFNSWPAKSFAEEGRKPSFKRSRGDIWCFAKIDWLTVQDLTLSQQYLAYCDSALRAVGRIHGWNGKPKSFDVGTFESDLKEVLSRGDASAMARLASQ